MWEWLDRWGRRNKHVCRDSIQKPSHMVNSISADFSGLQSICVCQNPYLVSPVNSCTFVGCCEKNIWYVVLSLLCFATSTHEIHLLFRKYTQWHQSWIQDDDCFCFLISKYWSYQHTNSGPSAFYISSLWSWIDKIKSNTKWIGGNAGEFKRKSQERTTLLPKKSLYILCFVT